MMEKVGLLDEPLTYHVLVSQVKQAEELAAQKQSPCGQLSKPVVQQVDHGNYQARNYLDYDACQRIVATLFGSRSKPKKRRVCKTAPSIQKRARTCNGASRSIPRLFKSENKLYKCHCELHDDYTEFENCSKCRIMYHKVCRIQKEKQLCRQCSAVKIPPVVLLTRAGKALNVELLKNNEIQACVPFKTWPLPESLNLETGNCGPIQEIVEGKRWFAPIKFGVAERMLASQDILTGRAILGINSKNVDLYLHSLEGAKSIYRGFKDFDLSIHLKRRRNMDLLDKLRHSCTRSNATIAHAVICGKLYLYVIATATIPEDEEIVLDTVKFGPCQSELCRTERDSSSQSWCPSTSSY